MALRGYVLHSHISRSSWRRRPFDSLGVSVCWPREICPSISTWLLVGKHSVPSTTHHRTFKDAVIFAGEGHSFFVPKMIETCLCWVGGIFIVTCIAYVVYVALEVHVFPGRSLTTYGANPKLRGAGSWALVTGATDGIGREFAMQLAARGFNIVAVSRTAEKLAILSKEIESTMPGIKTCYYAMDFLSAGDAEYEGLEQLIRHLDIAVLVNNVGLSHTMPVNFLEMDGRELASICQVNIVATMQVTRVVAPHLVRRGRGLILNLGSFSGQWSTPLLATYAGSKAFLIAWTQALGEEMRRSHVDVQLLNTYFVVSSMSKVRKPSMMVPTPKNFVRSALSRIGRSSGALGRPFTLTPFPSHAWLDWAVEHFVPRWWLLRQAYDVSLDTRRRAIRKAQRLEKSQ